jgi:hypothetical protein
MLQLFTLVKVGMAARANPRQPSPHIRARLGMRPWAKAASKYSSADPSRQMTTMDLSGSGL